MNQNNLIVALVAVIAIGGLVFFDTNATGGVILTDDVGTFYTGNRHSCGPSGSGSNVIGYDMPSYYAQGYYYYDCYTCPGDAIHAQPHVMCKYLPPPTRPVGAPQGVY